MTSWLEEGLEAIVRRAILRDSLPGCEARDEALQHGEGRDGKPVTVSAVYRDGESPKHEFDVRQEWTKDGRAVVSLGLRGPGPGRSCR